MALFALLFLVTATPGVLGRRGRHLGAVSVTPVEKVVTLLQGLKQQVQTEGGEEAKTYDQFACFCKSSTETKSSDIKYGSDDIDWLSAETAQLTGRKRLLASDLVERQQRQEEDMRESQAVTARCAKEQATYEADALDMSNAIASLQSALGSLHAADPNTFSATRLTGWPSLLERSAAVARKMQIKVGTAVGALLKQGTAVDPDAPDYAYHSDGIISTLDDLFKLFTDKKRELDDEWAKTDQVCRRETSALKDRIKGNRLAMEQIEGMILQLTSDLAYRRERLIFVEGELKDDQQYLQQLTERCQIRATDWDQRSQLRKKELEAIQGALNVMQNKVQGLDEAVSQRSEVKKELSDELRRDREERVIELPPDIVPESFLQVSSSGATATSTKARQEKVVAVISAAAAETNSSALSLLAMHAAGDPFTKVKGLIQRLVERLLAEANAEVTKKGFCDESLATDRQARQFRSDDAMKLNVKIAGLEAKHDALVEEIARLAGEIRELKEELQTAKDIRDEEHKENIRVLEGAGEAVTLVKEAIAILRTFYRSASRARVLLQASPVDEDTAGAGFAGAYKGKQEASNGIIGMLEVILTDFELTVRKTQDEEKRSRTTFVDFERASESSISAKETKKELDEEDLRTNKATTVSKMNDLQTAVDLVDAALLSIEHLRSECIDTTMSYKDRVENREKEVTALKTALCILDTENVEADCNN